MKDKILIINCGDIMFDTRPAGALVVDNGVVKFDKVKTFNAARRLLNTGLNMFYVNRFALTTWTPPAAVPFDWESPGYFELMREYVQVLHRPIQEVGATQLPPGAEIVIDPFLGCIENWMYSDYAKSAQLINAFFAALGDLPYVHFAIGRECDAQDSWKWVRDCVGPAFKAAGRVPFSYGASYCQAGAPGPMELQKGWGVEKVWDEATALKVYRPVHGVKDETSESLGSVEHGSIYNWCQGGNPICVIWSVDGVWDGDSQDDFIKLPSGQVQRRPSTDQIKSALRYALNNSPRKLMADGQVKYGFETMTKAMTIDVAVKQVQAVAEIHSEIFGVVPENYGQWPNDWVEPECQIGQTKTEKCWDGSVIITHVCKEGKWQATGTACPVKPPTCTAWYHLKRLNFKAWFAHIQGKHNK